MKILVKSDTYNMCNRIKKFDSSYRLVFDTVANVYEIYSTKLHLDVELIGGVPLSYVLRIPYQQLDERIIKYLYDTSTDNIEGIIQNIEFNNQQIEHESDEKLKYESLMLAENRLRQLT